MRNSRKISKSVLISVKSSFPELRARPWPGTREEAFLEMSRGKTRLWCGSSNVVFSMVSLKVDNLTYRTTNRDLEYLFEKYGKVSRLVFLTDIFIIGMKYSRSETSTYQGTSTAKRAGDLLSSDFWTEGTRRMQWTLWMAGNTMAGK